MMQDHLQSHTVDMDDRCWVPSEPLRRRLLAGSWAALAAGSLFAASSIATLSHGHGHGFTVADGFAWAAILPAMVTAFAYSALAEEVDSVSLAKSAQCLFLVTVLLRLYDLATANVFNLFGEIVLWIILALGFIGVLIRPFVHEQEASKSAEALKKEAAPRGKEASGEVTGSGATRAGLLGALVIGLFALFKFFGKFIVKVAIFKGVVDFFQKLEIAWDRLAGGLLYLSAVFFALWFGITKIRLSQRLGGLAALLGWAEILRLLILVGCGIMLWQQIAEAAQQPGANDQALQEMQRKLFHDYTIIELGTDLVWTALTVCFFRALAVRRDPDTDYADDFLSENTPAAAD